MTYTGLSVPFFLIYLLSLGKKNLSGKQIYHPAHFFINPAFVETNKRTSYVNLLEKTFPCDYSIFFH